MIVARIPAQPAAPAVDTGDPRTLLMHRVREALINGMSVSKPSRWMHRVREALMALPGYFNSSTNIEGIDAEDLFA